MTKDGVALLKEALREIIQRVSTLLSSLPNFQSVTQSLARWD